MDDKILGDVMKLGTRIDPDAYEHGAKEILAVLKQDWNQEAIHFEKCGVGFINLVLVASISQAPEDKVVFRIFGSNVYTSSIVPEHQVAATLLLSEIGLSPKVLCLFENGICFEHVEGEKCNWNDSAFFEDVRVPKASVRELARFHCKRTCQLAVEKYKIPSNGNLKIFLNKLFGLWPTEVLIDEPEGKELFCTIPPRDVIRAELDEIIKMIADLKLPVVFCHSDAAIPNVIYIKEQDKAILVDYDMTDFRYAEYDLANLLTTACLGVDPVELTNIRWSPGYWKDVLREYLVTRSELDGEEFKEIMVEECYVKVKKMSLAYLLAYVIYTFIDAGLPELPFGVPSMYLKLGINVYNNHYLRMKQEIMEMKLPQ